ncbi:hypothetical protein GJ496_010529, partial [Pomphorhynchus laevis]
MQCAIDELSGKLEDFGLKFRPQKCNSLMFSFRCHTWKESLSPFFKIRKYDIPCNFKGYGIKYLGVFPFGGDTESEFVGEMNKFFLRLESSRLSPTQKVHLINDYLL